MKSREYYYTWKFVSIYLRSEIENLFILNAFDKCIKHCIFEQNDLFCDKVFRLNPRN